eukprot:4214856-Amphidinium_carterae.1
MATLTSSGQQVLLVVYGVPPPETPMCNQSRTQSRPGVCMPKAQASHSALAAAAADTIPTSQGQISPWLHEWGRPQHYAPCQSKG